MIIQEILHLNSHFFGSFVVLAKLVGQAGIWVCTNEERCFICHFFQIRTHIFCSHRAVQTDTQQVDVADRVQKSLHCLTRQRTSAGIGDCSRNHDRQTHTALIQLFFNGKQSGFRIQRVEDCLHKEQIDSPIQQAFYLLAVGFLHQIKRGGTITRVVHVGRKRQSFICWPQRTGNVTRFVWIFSSKFIRHFAGNDRRLFVDFVHPFFGVVISLRNTGGIEGIGLNDVGTGIEKCSVDAFNHIRTCHRKQIVVPKQFVCQTGQFLISEIFLLQPVLLDHGPHRPIKHQYPVFQFFTYIFFLCHLN